MNQVELLAKIAAGYGMVAQRLGTVCSHFRAAGTSSPIAAGNYKGSLAVFFSPADKLQDRPQWLAAFDCSVTKPGDYLVADDGVIYFIAAQVAFAQMICVQTNAEVSLIRPASVVADASGYSGVVMADAVTLLSGWPASVVASGRAKEGTVPDDDGLSAWVVMLPQIPVVPQVADLLVDNEQRIFAVISVERTSLGWELRGKQVSS